MLIKIKVLAGHNEKATHEFWRWCPCRSGGPAEIIAATNLSHYNSKSCLVDSMPALGQKFLMADKSGLNITTSKSDFLKEYCEPEEWIIS